jgi:hypothetical protein
MNLSIKELNELIYSLGITAHNGNFCNREVNESLLERLYCELNDKIAEEAIDEEIETPEYPKHECWCGSYETCDCISDPNDNEETDEDLEDVRERGYITQSLLDYVDRNGAVSHGELEEYYKQITGSNSFSHILANLRIPYKNRKTQRYIAKEGKRYSNAKYVIKVANPSNWVIVND